MMIVHLKSTSSYDDTPEKKMESREIRTKQAKVIDFWLIHALNMEKKRILL